MFCQLITTRIQLLSVCLLGLTSAAIRAETVWDLTDDFSKTSNPTGAWSYGTKSSLSGSFNLYDTTRIDRGTDTIWQYGTTSAYAPHLWKNETGAEVPGVGVPNGSVSLHPGPYSGVQPSIARWTAPLSGTVTLSGTFGAGDDAATDARIQLNETTIWESLDFTTDQAFSLTQYVDENDTIDWVVSGAWNDGNTPLTATVTIPEPTSLLIGSLVTGCGIGVGWHRRRKKRRRVSASVDG